MSFTIAFIGAGSTAFTRRLVADILSVPEFDAVRIVLQDINADNLRMVRELIERDVRHNGKAARIAATTDQREAVTGARYVFNCARVGGIDGFRTDVEIPLAYGIDQCVGDTLCAGGIMYGQRGIPMILDLCRDIREAAEPDATLFNYANPMAMMTWAANAHGGVRCVGLCHGVQAGHWLISAALGVPKAEIDYVCAGINHQTWYIRILHKGREIAGEELLAAMEGKEWIARQERCRIDVLRRFGHLSTESNGHLSEYLAWYRKRPDEIQRWIDTSVWINGETGGYLRCCMEKRDWFETDFPRWMEEPPHVYDGSKRSHEHGSWILEGLETGRVYRGHFNVVNRGVIANLAADAIVEAPGYVDRNGISMPLVGDLPLGCAAVCTQSINVQRLAVEAAVRGDDLLLRQAMLLDPLVGAVCDPPEVWQLVDDMLIAQERWLPQYGDAIAAAKRRQADGPRLPTRPDYRGAVRLPVRSVEELRAEKEREAARKKAQATAVQAQAS